MSPRDVPGELALLADAAAALAAQCQAFERAHPSLIASAVLVAARVLVAKIAVLAEAERQRRGP